MKKKIKLPQTIILDKHLLDEYLKDEYDIDDLESAICNYFTDIYRFCINSLCYKIKGDKIICFNIDWDTTD